MLPAVSHESTCSPADSTVQQPLLRSIVTDLPSAVISAVRRVIVTSRVSPLPETSYVRFGKAIDTPSMASS